MAPEDDAAMPPRIPPLWWKVGLGALAALICLGALLRLMTDSSDIPRAGDAVKGRSIALTSTLPGVGTKALFATDGDLYVDNEPLWVLERSGRELTIRRMKLVKGTARSAPPVKVRLAEERTKGVFYDVVKWDGGESSPAVVTVAFGGGQMTTIVQEISSGRVLREGKVTMRAPGEGLTRNVAVVRYEGARPDVVVVDRGRADERPTVSVVSGERGFEEVSKQMRLPFRGFSPKRWRLDFAKFDGPNAEMFAFRTPRAAGRPGELNIAHGEAGFAQFSYSPKLELEGDPDGLVIKTGKLRGAPSAYVIRRDGSTTRADVIQLIDEVPRL